MLQLRTVPGATASGAAGGAGGACSGGAGGGTEALGGGDGDGDRAAKAASARAATDGSRKPAGSIGRDRE